MIAVSSSREGTHKSLQCLLSFCNTLVLCHMVFFLVLVHRLFSICSVCHCLCLCLNDYIPPCDVDIFVTISSFMPHFSFSIQSISTAFFNCVLGFCSWAVLIILGFCWFDHLSLFPQSLYRGLGILNWGLFCWSWIFVPWLFFL